MSVKFLPALRAPLLLAWAAAAVACVALHTPLPWMLGPWLPRPCCPWPVRPPKAGGCAMAGSGRLAPRWACTSRPRCRRSWAACGGPSCWALRGAAAGLGLWRVALPPARAAHARGARFNAAVYQLLRGAIGAASEMTLLCPRENARTDLGGRQPQPAPAHRHDHHSICPAVERPAGAGHFDPTVRDVSWPGLALLALLTGAGALVMDRLGRANPWFMGAMLVSMAVTMAGCICRQCRKRWSMPRSS